MQFLANVSQSEIRKNPPTYVLSIARTTCLNSVPFALFCRLDGIQPTSCPTAYTITCWSIVEPVSKSTGCPAPSIPSSLVAFGGVLLRYFCGVFPRQYSGWFVRTLNRSRFLLFLSLLRFLFLLFHFLCSDVDVGIVVPFPLTFHICYIKVDIVIGYDVRIYLSIVLALRPISLLLQCSCDKTTDDSWVITEPRTSCVVVISLSESITSCSPKSSSKATLMTLP